MKLTAEQAKKVLDYIIQKTENNPIVCPICRNEQWKLNDILTETREFNDDKIPMGPELQVMPFVSIICNNCGHTLLINAIRAGIVDPQPKKNEDGPQGQTNSREDSKQKKD